MYIPSHFSQPDVEEIRALLASQPLATLVSMCSEAGLSAEHVPLLWRDDGSEHGVLVGHVARPNPLWQRAAPELSVLAVFHGPQVYISPNWYASKQETGRVVPTWNYSVVHAHGILRVHHDADWLMTLLSDLTNHFENAMVAPWSVADAPEDYTARLVQAIAGIEIRLTRVEAKWKMSQNQPPANQATVVDGLMGLGTDQALAVASMMNSVRQSD